MSLINDALKRAKHAQRKRPPPATSGPALRPIEPARRSDSGPAILIVLCLVVLVFVGGFVVWFAMQSSSARESLPILASTKSVPAPLGSTRMTVSPPVAAPLLKSEAKLNPARLQNFTPDVAIQTSNPAAAVTASKPDSTLAKPVVSAPLAPAPATPSSQPAAQLTASVLTATQLVAAITPATTVSNEPPAPPSLPRLQGIFYRPDRPAALLNGKTVLVGNTSGEYSVLAISRRGVTVVRAGKTNILTMPN